MGDTVRQRRVNGVFGDVALHAKVVVIASLFRQCAALHLHAVRHLPGAENHFAHAAHRLGIRGGQRECADIVQHIFRSDGFPANARFGKSHILGDIRVEVVADHQHIEMFIDGIDRIGQGRVGGGGQNIRVRTGGNNIRRVAATGPFRVEGMDGAPADGRQRVFDETGFVQRVAVQRHLNIHLFRHFQRAVDGRRRRAPVFVDLKPDGPGGYLLAQGIRVRTVAFTQQADIHWQGIGSLQHAGDIPRPRRAGGGVGPCRGTCTAADHRRDAGNQRLFGLLWADPVDMSVDPASGDDLSFGGDRFRGGTDRDRHPGLNVRVTGFANGKDPPVLHADIRFHDPPVIDNQRVSQHQIHAVIRGHLPLAHTVADHFPAAEFDLFAVDGEIVFDFDPQLAVG